ncbi:MAG: hypothetical protein ACLUPV_07285 [Bilophila wadsworthia]
MNQSFFKEILEQEIHSVFLNPAEFESSRRRHADVGQAGNGMARRRQTAFPTGSWCCPWPCPTPGRAAPRHERDVYRTLVRGHS